MRGPGVPGSGQEGLDEPPPQVPGPMDPPWIATAPPSMCKLKVDGLLPHQFADHGDHRHYGDGTIEVTHPRIPMTLGQEPRLEPCPRGCHGFGRCPQCGDTGYITTRGTIPILPEGVTPSPNQHVSRWRLLDCGCMRDPAWLIPCPKHRKPSLEEQVKDLQEAWAEMWAAVLDLAEAALDRVASWFHRG